MKKIKTTFEHYPIGTEVWYSSKHFDPQPCGVVSFQVNVRASEKTETYQLVTKWKLKIKYASPNQVFLTKEEAEASL